MNLICLSNGNSLKDPSFSPSQLSNTWVIPLIFFCKAKGTVKMFYFYWWCTAFYKFKKVSSYVGKYYPQVKYFW